MGFGDGFICGWMEGFRVVWVWIVFFFEIVLVNKCVGGGWTGRSWKVEF